MDLGQQFCLRWNNYQSTLQHVFYKLWQTGTFVDASLVVEGRRIDCHKVVLSACSSYFEDILQEHSSQHHPLILLHDMPFKAVEALVAFMYRGEVNVSHTQLESLLQVAEALKVKGLADSSALSNFTKRSLLERCMPLLEQSPSAAAAFASNRYLNLPEAVTYPTTAIVQPRMMSSATPTVNDRNGSAVMKQATKAVKRFIKGGRSPGPKKKRPRNDKGIPSMPSSPVSGNDSPPCDQTDNVTAVESPSQPSPTPPLTTPEMLKQEAADETDGELQIDESVGQSPEGSVEGDSNSTGECEKEIVENGKSATQDQDKKIVPGSDLPPLEPVKKQEQTQTPSVDAFSIPKERKSIERTYTHLDLEQGIEAVLLGRLTPAKAIAHYRIPRRTFFRRLSAVRKSRGIPSAKENAADQFLMNTSGTVKESNNQHLHSVSNTETYTAPFKVKSEKQLLMDTKDSKVKCNKKNTAVMTPSSSYLALLKLAASNNYDTYIKYLRMVAQQSGHSKPEEFLEALKKVHIKEIRQTVDDNRNVATEVSGAALCLVNKNLVNEVPETPLSLVNGNKNLAEVPDVSEAHYNTSDSNTVAEVPDDNEFPINLYNGKEVSKATEKLKEECPKEVEIAEEGGESSDDDSSEPSPGSPSQDIVSRKLIPAAIAEIPQDLILPRSVSSNSASDVPQNLVSRSNKMTAEVS
ncbi:transcription activator GAGA-like [Palaemon carinicauda]|uniref:transcription activator GAGA-like n=1 Tax=Palaemon carinicauda TaxID=392227 RepID=UPI0035B6AB65